MDLSWQTMQQNPNLDYHPCDSNAVAMPVEFNTQSVAAWLDELPLANLDRSGDALLALLRTMNRLKSLSCADRIGMIEQLRPTAYMLSQHAVERHLHDPAFPLSGPLKRHADRGWQLPLELGKGYRLVVMHEGFANPPALGRDLCALTVYRALDAYGTSLLRLSEGYRTAEAGFWRDVYGLYQLAETLQLHKLTVSDEGATILDRFIHIVLFALCGSHRHRPGKIRQIYELLRMFASAAQIQPTPQLNGQDALFFVDLGMDAPPRRVQAPGGRPTANRRFVFTHLLIPVLLKHFEDPLNRRLTSGVVDKPLLRRLVKTLGALERRKFARVAEDGQCGLLIGLDRLIGVLSGASRPQEAPAGSESTVQYKGISWLKVPSYSLETPDRSVWAGRRRDERIQRSEISIAKTLRERSTGVAPGEIWAQGVATPSAQPETVGLSGRLVNSSARGHCLLWTKNAVPGAKVGELVGLALDDSSLHIGVIRWLHQDSDLMFGVELLSPKAEVVEVSFTGERDRVRIALFLPPNAVLQQPAGLLIDPSCCDLEDVIVREGTGVAKTYRIEKLLESTPAFRYFSLA